MHWIAESIEEFNPTTLKKSLQKIIAPQHPIDENEASNDESMLILTGNLPVSEKKVEEDIAEWISADF